MAAAFVLEVEELADEFAAALFFVEFDGLKHGAVEFDEAITARDFAPRRHDVVAAGAVFRVKVAETGQKLHRVVETIAPGGHFKPGGWFWLKNLCDSVLSWVIFPPCRLLLLNRN